MFTINTHTHTHTYRIINVSTLSLPKRRCSDLCVVMREKKIKTFNNDNVIISQ